MISKWGWLAFVCVCVCVCECVVCCVRRKAHGFRARNNPSACFWLSIVLFRMLSCIFSDGYCAELRSAIPGVFLRLPIWSSGEEEFALKQSVAVERDDEHHTLFFFLFFCVSKKNSSPPRGVVLALCFFLFPVDFFGFGHNPEPHLFPAPDCISFREMLMFIWRGFWGSWRWRKVERECVRAFVCVCVDRSFLFPALLLLLLLF